ncbi:dihydrodipicolinate synthase family protein, partial [Georgenia sp. 10Sc9-8]|nr:dihydrodipicolinate synthase family protein [Georgenia halotolerans]
AHGASGVVSVAGHVCAARYAEMVAEVDAGDLSGARTVATQVRPLVGSIMGTGQGAVMAKHAMHLRGLIGSPAVRLPLVPAPAAEVDALARAMRTEGLLPG